MVETVEMMRGESVLLMDSLRIVNVPSLSYLSGGNDDLNDCSSDYHDDRRGRESQDLIRL